MVADSNSPLLGFLIMGPGNDNNSWGDNHNNNVSLVFETKIADTLSVATTGGTLTVDHGIGGKANYGTLILTGVLAADLVITVPDHNFVYRIINNTTGAFFTRLKCTTAATAVNVPAGGKTTEIIAAGGIPIRTDAPEVGRYVMDAAVLGGDVLEADGAAYKRASLPDLFAKYGTTYGNNDGTDFKVPDAKTLGKFLRSRTGSVPVGTAQTNQNAAHTHTFSGALTIGTMSIDSGGSHTHGITDPGHTHVITGNSGTRGIRADLIQVTVSDVSAASAASSTTGITINSGGAHTHTISGIPGLGTLATVSQGGTEARPEALVGILCVRY